MDNTVFSLIGSLGFPIIMCLLLYKQQIETVKSHHDEMDEMRKSIDNNTLIVQKLLDKMDEEVRHE